MRMIAFQDVAFWKPKKGAASPWGRTGRARTRSGDGEGWGRDRARVATVFGPQSVRGWGERPRARFAERDPDIRIGLRLAFDEAVTGVRPQHDVVGLVVEDVFALVAFDRQYGVAVVVLVAHHGDQQRLARPAGLHQHLAFLQHVVLAVAVTVIG